jgi:hypothetical protein
MAKLNWEISRPEYGVQFEITANTRSEAIGKAEAQWLADTSWEDELVGTTDDGGRVFARSPIPEFVATKLGRAK